MQVRPRPRRARAAPAPRPRGPAHAPAPAPTPPRPRPRPRPRAGESRSGAEATCQSHHPGADAVPGQVRGRVECAAGVRGRGGPARLLTKCLQIL